MDRMPADGFMAEGILANCSEEFRISGTASKKFDKSMAITTVREEGFYSLNLSTTFWVRSIRAEVIELFLCKAC